MVVSRGGEAVSNARAKDQSNTSAYRLLCLRAVREYLEIGSFYASARDAWEESDQKVHASSWDKIPYGAPAFTNCTQSEYGHIVLMGGRLSDGERVTWTTDQFGDGRITPVRASFYQLQWGHQLNGWSRELNTVDIPFLEKGDRKPLTREQKLVRRREGAERSLHRAHRAGNERRAKYYRQQLEHITEMLRKERH